MARLLLFPTARARRWRAARLHAAGAAALLARASRQALRYAASACRAWAARRLLREMREWPDERLRDIGLSRHELAAAILGTQRPFRWVPETDAEPPHFRS